MKKEILHIREGLELHPDPNNPDNMLVTWTDLHEEGLDTSLKTNPIYNCGKFEINGHKIPVISMFKRKASKHQKGDGNPALYALKNEKNFVLTNRNAFLNRFNLILSKFVAEFKNQLTVLMPDYEYSWHPDTLLPIPSTNPLNSYITKSVASKFKGIDVVRGALSKFTYEDVLHYIMNPNFGYYDLLRDLMQSGMSKAKAEAYILTIPKTFRGIDPTLKSPYKRHSISDPALRRAIKHTMKANPNYDDAINGKNVILLDDSITFGASIKESLQVLYDVYEPKSVIVITMFSEKYKR